MTLAKTFGRSQIAALAATAVDFGSLVFLVEVAHVYYVVATAIGALLGAVTNFTMGRHWTFHPGEGALFDAVHAQARRYALVSAGSLALNTFGVYFFTEVGKTPYVASKAVAAILISVFFNFPLHRHYVFR